MAPLSNLYFLLSFLIFRLHETEFVFSDLFWSIWNKKGYKLPSDTTKCYMFEMITPSHIIVVRPEADEVYLHGARDLVTLEEVQPGPIAEEVYKCVISVELRSMVGL
jgi:hypothetical protein